MTRRGFRHSTRSNGRPIARGTVVGIGVFLLFGLVTGLVPNPLYVRMVPRTSVDYLLLTLTALLAGIYTAQRSATEVTGSRLEGEGKDDRSSNEDRWAMGAGPRCSPASEDGELNDYIVLVDRDG